MFSAAITCQIATMPGASSGVARRMVMDEFMFFYRRGAENTKKFSEKLGVLCVSAVQIIRMSQFR
jgi:hypothetical protein